MNDDIISLPQPDGTIKKVSPLDLIDPKSPKVSSDERKNRLSHCKSCEYLNFLGQCTHCYCFMTLKTWLADASCPIGKWDSINK